jgi:copper ion binding protein
MSTQTFHVTGMTCDHCKTAVTNEIGAIDGVEAVTVDLTTGEVTVTATTPIDLAAVAAAVDEAGYELAS